MFNCQFAAAVAFVILTLLFPGGRAIAFDEAGPPVVVELFTSESCSSCPPADALLLQLSQQRIFAGRELILLSEHVDYWNDTGWKDRFSLPALSDRQSAYETALHLDSRYTPQFVIDGRIDAPGNDGRQVRRSIEQAAQTEKPANITVAHLDADHVQINVHHSGTEKAQVLLAITEDDLSTSVTHGENGGRTLRNSAVVRSWRSLGPTANGEFRGSASVVRQSDWQAEKLRLVILVQRTRDLAVIGAASLPYQ